jgi:hypothetical protein
MSFGGLDDGGRALGGFDLVQFSGGRVVEGDVAGLPAPLDYQAAVLGLFEPLALALEVPDEGVLVPGDVLVQLFGGYFSRVVDPRSLDHLLVASLSRYSCSATRSRTVLLAVDQSRLQMAASSHRMSRQMRTFRESVWAVLTMIGLRTAPASPFAHALDVFVGVVAVAVTIAESRR